MSQIPPGSMAAMYSQLLVGQHFQHAEARLPPEHYQRWSTFVRAAILYNTNHVVIDGESWNPEQQLPVEEERIITPQEFRSTPALVLVDPRFLLFLDQQPERLLSLSPWKFQEVVAQVLEELGYRSQLGPKGRDGGVDIIASREAPLGGMEIVLVQCKRHAADNKVTEPVVKQLAMEVDDKKATRGLIVTTSTFTSVALKYIEAKKHKLAGADGEKLREWIRIATTVGS